MRSLECDDKYRPSTHSSTPSLETSTGRRHTRVHGPSRQVPAVDILEYTVPRDKYRPSTHSNTPSLETS
ncbi:hypothetical protein LSAT2_024430, partial [Lamellibrachia satsuma]